MSEGLTRRRFTKRFKLDAVQLSDREDMFRRLIVDKGELLAIQDEARSPSESTAVGGG